MVLHLKINANFVLKSGLESQEGNRSLGLYLSIHTNIIIICKYNFEYFNIHICDLCQNKPEISMEIIRYA